jgi:1-acyl-sn-glycerol-3-phosphate acyltransferase
MALHMLAAAAILRIVFPGASPARRRALVGWWSAKLLRIVGVATRVEGEPPGESEAGTMIAANHVSWLDIFAISGVRPTRFIAKSEIRDWPLAGWIVERAGTIFIRRERRRDYRAHQRPGARRARAGRPRGPSSPTAAPTTEGGPVCSSIHTSLFEPAISNRATTCTRAPSVTSTPTARCGRAIASTVGELSFHAIGSAS